MSWIKRHPLLAIAALALSLRAAAAVVTEYKPIFPAYYYTDADGIHAAAARALEDVNAGRAPSIGGTLSERIQTLISLDVYRVFGPRTLPVKLLNALMGALSVAALVWALARVFSPEPALLAGFLVAVWPSHVFYTSQNLKEAPSDLLAYAALGAALTAGLDSSAPRSRAAAFALGAALALMGAGFYRSYVLLCLSSALLLALGLTAVSRAARANALTAAAALIATLAFYPAASRAVLGAFASHDSSATLDRVRSPLIPITYDEFTAGAVDRPTSPAGISAFRKSRQFADRRWAKEHDREIGTQIYPDAEFKTWGDVLAYIPKGAFAVLFMPLPGLYPMDGKLGRYAAAGENVILLALALLAAVGIARGPKTPARLGLLAFFASMTIGAALLEFDLGSAGRHKLLYLPMLFPFAAEEILRLLGRKEPA